MRLTICLGVFLAISLLLLTVTALSAGEEYLSGTIVDQKGNATRITRIAAEGRVAGIFKGKKIKIGFAKLKKVENLGNDIFRVTNLQGRQFNIEQGLLSTYWKHHEWRFCYHFFDEISLEEKKGIDVSANFLNHGIHSISFGDDIGRLKFNSRTKKFYPPDYVFDPFTGEKLIWKNPEY